MDEFSENPIRVGDVVIIVNGKRWMRQRFIGVLWKVMITHVSDPRLPPESVVVVRLDEFGGMSGKITGDIYAFDQNMLRLVEPRQAD